MNRLVPAPRLLWWTALIVAPAFAALGVGGAALPLAVLAIGFVTLLAALDAVLSRALFEGLTIQWPETVRLTQDRPGELELRITNKAERPRRLRIGLDLPLELKSEDAERDVILPAGTERPRLNWPVLPTRRGRYLLPVAYLELVSPLGFWAVRRRQSIEGEVRVYPNLMSEHKTTAALFLNHGQVGMHAMRMVGKGRDFEKLREYIPGDSYDEISWKATAKRGHPVTKIFQIERTQEVYCILDASRLSARAPGGAGGSLRPDGMPSLSILDRSVLAALILGIAAERQGDLFGLITYSDRIQRFVPAKAGREHYNTCRDALYTLQPQLVAPDYRELFAFLRARLRKRALLVFLTSLDDPALAESFARNVSLICRQHLIVVNMLSPADARPLFDAPDIDTVEDLYPRLAGHLQWAQLRRLEKVLYRNGARFNVLRNERLCADIVSQYMAIKQRQAL